MDVLSRCRLKRREWSSLIPLLLGVIAFCWITRGKILNPTQVEWLFWSDDPATSFMGWHFFRTEPLFQWPFGLTRHYGQELGNSVIFTDSIPIFAFLFRPFSVFLPHYFQYTGFWLLLCYCLQGVFAWKIFERLELGLLSRALLCAFFIVAPPFVWRSGGMFALAAHWIVLAAIWLLLSDYKVGWRWTLLLLVASLVNVYLLVMLLVVWGGAILKELLCNECSLKKACLHLVSTAVWVTGIMWFAGYFVLQGGQDIGGFGSFRMNLNSLVNPVGGWSRLLREQPIAPGEIEGFNYLGLGTLLLGVLALGALARSAHLRFNWRTILPFALVMFALTAYAVTNRIALGNTELGFYPLVYPFSKFAAMFRSSGRMFWPVYYLLMVGIFSVLCRSFSKTALNLLLGIAFLIQVTDCQVALHWMAKQFPVGVRWTWPLKSDFWETAAGVYKQVIYVLPDNDPPGYFPLALYAADHRMAINVGYFGRIDDVLRDQLRRQLLLEISKGEFRRDCLYVFQNEAVWQVAVETLGEADGAAIVDGWRIVAPQWATLSAARVAPLSTGTAAKAAFRSTVPPISRLSFAAGQSGAAHLIAGWNRPEDWGTWTGAKSAALLVSLPAPVNSDQILTIEGRAFLLNVNPREDIEILVNDRSIGSWHFAIGQQNSPGEFRIPKNLIDDSAGRLIVEFHISHPVSPASLNLSNDGRLLGFGLERLQITPVSDDLKLR